MVRPFSSPSDTTAPDPVADVAGNSASGGLFDGVLARGGVRTAVGDRAWLSAMLRVEAAVARAQAVAGVIPPEAATVIGDACTSADIDPATLSFEAAASGNPVVPLVARMRSTLPAVVAPYFHKATTSQDILDTAAMVLAHRALGIIVRDLRAAADAAADLARAHRDTPMVGRTLLQQAVPTTFGLKAAGWTTGLDEATDRLVSVRTARLAIQFGGAAGTRAGLGKAAPEVAHALAAELGLADPVLPWHTIRTRIADLAGALGGAAGVAAKVARDVILLAQDEVAEVSEGSPGGSSAMVHKRNPVAAISTVACASQAPGLVATLLAAMVHEHERAAGSWHAEWRPMRELLVATGSAAAWLAECLTHLTVRAETMRSNLDRLLDVLGTAEPDVGAAAPLVDRMLAQRTGKVSP